MLRRAIVFCALGLCCCLPAFAAETPIAVQTGKLFDISGDIVEVQTGSGTKLFAPTDRSTVGVLCTTSIEGTGYLWWCVGPGPAFIPLWATQEVAVFEPQKSGEHIILLAVQLASGAWQQLSAAETIIIEEEEPDPPPPPPPPPPPSEELEGLLIHEAHDTTFNQAKVINSVRLREVSQFTLEVYDKDTLNEGKVVPEDLVPWLKIIKANGWSLPRLLLVNTNGDLVAHQTPDTVDSTITFVKEHLK